MSRAGQAHPNKGNSEPEWPGLVGPYRTLTRIGEGSLGAVFKARDERSGDIVAIKLAHGSSPWQNSALRREAALLLDLANAGPGVVRALETGRTEGRSWYSMEYVDGTELRELVAQLWRAPLTSAPHATTLATESLFDEPLRSGTRPSSLSGLPSALGRDTGRRASSALELLAPQNGPSGGTGAGSAARRSLPLRLALALGAKLARALAGLHAAGVVHSDLSPSNVLVDPRGDPTLVDFSSAFLFGAAETARELAQGELGVRGTPGYMAPEQILGQCVDGRADLYALGCLLYELISGSPPFAGDRSSLLRQHLRAAPTPLSQRNQDVPPDLDRLVLALLEKEPGSRYPYAADLALALTALAQDEPPFGEATGPGSLTPLYRARLVERDDVVQALVDRAQAAVDGQGGVAVVTAELGGGKTRLLNELAIRAQILGMEVVAGRAAEGGAPWGGSGAAVALGPLTGLFERAADDVSAESPPPPQLTKNMQILATYLPGTAGARLGPAGLEAATMAEPRLDLGPAPTPVLPPDLARGRVARALAGLLAHLSRGRPLLLLIDDAHLADELTLDFLRRVILGELKLERTLVAASCRPESLSPALLSALAAHPELRHDLNRLELDGVRALAREMLATDFLPEGLGEFIFQESGGNPLFAAEQLKLLAARGGLHREAGRRWSFHEPQSAARSLPSSVQELLGQVQARLGVDDRRALSRACVHRLGFHWEQLLSGTPPHSRAEVTQAIQHLVSHGLLEEFAPERYRFVHEQLRAAWEDSLSPEDRRSLHHEAYRALEENGARPEAAENPLELAIHLAELSEHYEAARFYERAAQHAAAQHQYSHAAALYRAALEQASKGGPEGPELGSELSTRLRDELTEMLLRGARHDECRLHCDRIVEDPAASGLVRARALRKKSKSFWLIHDYGQASSTLDQAAAALGPLEGLSTQSELQEWIEISQGRFWIYYFGRKIGAESQALVAKMAEVVESAGTAAQKAMFYQCAAGELMARERYLFSPTAVETARRGVAFSDPVRYPVDAADARFALGFALVQGDHAACREAAQNFMEAIASLEEIADATVMARLLTYLAIAHRRLGDVPAVQRTATRAAAAADAARLPTYLAAATACLGWVAWREGDLALGERKALLADEIWSKDRHAFPFRRLSAFVILNARRLREDYAGTASVLRALAAPDQQRLPGELEEALLASLESCSTPDPPHPPAPSKSGSDGELDSSRQPRAQSEALDALLSRARDLGFD